MTKLAEVVTAYVEGELTLEDAASRLAQLKFRPETANEEDVWADSGSDGPETLGSFGELFAMRMRFNLQPEEISAFKQVLRAKAGGVAAHLPGQHDQKSHGNWSGSAGALEGMDAHTALATSYSAWMDDNATPEQKAAFQLYTMTSVYKQWNPYLRGQGQEGIDEKDIEQIRNLDSLIAQSDGAESDILVYRGIRDANSVFGTQAAAGTIIVDDAFVSTTMDHGIKERYAGADASGAVMTIKIPQGTPIAVAKTEGQVLLPTRTKMKIVSDQTVEQIVDQAGYDMLLDMGFTGDELQERLELYKVVQVTRTIEAEVVT